jgi:polyhydroxyalkanoate synthesis regulator phasin
MDDREYWTRQLREAERELDAATRRSDVNAAAKRLQLVKAELRQLEAKATRRPKRRSSRASGPAGASS